MKASYLPLVLLLAGSFSPSFAQPAPSSLPPEVEAQIKARIEAYGKAPGGEAPPVAISAAQSAARRGGPASLATWKTPDGVTMDLVNISESRSASRGGPPLAGSLNLAIQVSGAALPALATVKEVKVANAVDSTGRSLLPDASSPARPPALAAMQMMSTISAAARGVGAATRILGGTATLRTSSRDATAIKLAEGTVEMFTPSETNGSIVVIKQIGSRGGTPLEELTKFGIELTLVTPESVPAVQATFSGYQPNLAAGPVVFVKDPRSLFAGFVFRDGAGNVLVSGTSTRTGPNNAALYEVRLQSPAAGARGAQAPGIALPPDGQLALYLAVPEAVTSVPFRFENISLP